MSEAIEALAAQVNEPNSTVLDAQETPSTSGSGYTPEADTFNDTIKAALDQVKAEPAPEIAPEAEPEVKEKAPKEKAEEPAVDEEPAKAPARSKDGKFQPAATPADAPAADAAQNEEQDGPQVIPPPERLLPDAKEKWKSTPRSVQRDISQWMQEAETEKEQYRVQSERYESIRPFDELAKTNGRDLRESLLKINQIENLMQSNPIAGLSTILQEIGPKRADGGSLSLYEVAQHIVNQGPQQTQQQIAQTQQQAQQQAQQDQFQSMQQELQSLRQEQVKAEINRNVVDPFRASHPRFDELKDEMGLQIQMLKMHPEYGKQFAGLSHKDQLSMAYERAERLNPPSSQNAESASNGLDLSARVEPDLSGTKSIRTGPGAVSPQEGNTGPKSLDDVLLNSLRKVRRA